MVAAHRFELKCILLLVLVLVLLVLLVLPVLLLVYMNLRMLLKWQHGLFVGGHSDHKQADLDLFDLTPARKRVPRAPVDNKAVDLVHLTIVVNDHFSLAYTDGDGTDMALAAVDIQRIDVEGNLSVVGAQALQELGRDEISQGGIKRYVAIRSERCRRRADDGGRRYEVLDSCRKV